MENTKVELDQIQIALEIVAAQQVKELSELQLLLAGGGAGDVVFA